VGRYEAYRGLLKRSHHPHLALVHRGRRKAWLAQRDAVFLRQSRHYFRQLLRQSSQKCFDIFLLQFLDTIAYQIGFAQSFHEIVKRNQAFGDYRLLLFSAISGLDKIKEGDRIGPIWRDESLVSPTAFN
jgi:hypothetical protein